MASHIRGELLQSRWKALSSPRLWHLPSPWTARRRRGEMFRSVFSIQYSIFPHLGQRGGREVFSIQYSLTFLQSLDSEEEERWDFYLICAQLSFQICFWWTKVDKHLPQTNKIWPLVRSEGNQQQQGRQQAWLRTIRATRSSESSLEEFINIRPIKSTQVLQYYLKASKSSEPPDQVSRV